MTASQDNATDGPSAAGSGGHRWSVTIGSIGGIRIRVHASFVLIVVLFAIAGQGWSGVLGNLLWLVIIFACVLVHELAHSIVARRKGVTVRDIVLLPIGGVSELESIPEQPRDEFQVAIVGPLASLVLAAVAAAVTVAAGQALAPFDLNGASLLNRLVWFNLAVGVFNLLPAFPMDGGRVLRALLERRHDRLWATRRAAAIGRALGLVMAIAGVYVDLWLVLIGLFVFFGAAAEETATAMHTRLAGRKVRDVMLLDPLAPDAAMSAEQAAPFLRRSAQDELPVLDGDRYVGIASVDAVMSAPPTARLGTLADAAAPVLSPDDDLEEAMSRVGSDRRHRAHAVVLGDHLVGLLRPADIARAASGAAGRLG